MSASGFTPISLYYSTTASAVPTAANLVPGELAINTNDGKLYYEDSSGVVQVLATKSTGSIGGSNTQVQFNNSGSLGGSSGLTWDGSFLTTSSIKNSALTSGRVTYAGASGLLSDSANLVWDNTNARLGIGTASPSVPLHILNSGEELLRLATSGVNPFLSFYTGTTTRKAYIQLTSTGLLYDSEASATGHIFSTQGAEKLRITSAGNVGIGTSSPNAKLTVLGTAGALTNPATIEPIQINALTTTAGEGAGIRFNAASGAKEAVGVIGVVNNASGNLGSMTFHVYNGGGDIPEHMRIDSSGNLLVGTTTANSGVIIFPSFSSSGSSGININHVSTAASGEYYVVFQHNASIVGYISQVGTIGVAYNTTSDYRLKENIVPMTGALAKVAQLKPVTYKWKTDGLDGQGFIAHELQAVVPECVTGEKDAVDADGEPKYQGVDTSFLVATLTAAIQELKAEFDAYKATHP